MAHIESFKSSGVCPTLDADSFTKLKPTAVDSLLRGSRPQARKLLKEFRSACIKLFYPRGETTMVALLRALGGPLRSGGDGWTKSEESRCVAVLHAARAQAAHSTVGSCPRLVEGKLF
jgi:hypothetical protein